MITLVLNSEKRIVSAYLPDDPDETVIPEGCETVTIEQLPDEGLVNFRYENGEFLYEPLVMTESEKDSLEMDVDFELRLTMLELGM